MGEKLRFSHCKKMSTNKQHFFSIKRILTNIDPETICRTLACATSAVLSAFLLADQSVCLPPCLSVCLPAFPLAYHPLSLSLGLHALITEAKSTKELYHITNSTSARTKCTQIPTIFPLSDLPNLFSEFFQNKISKIRSDLDSQPCASHPLGKPFSGVPLLSFMPVSEKTVREILNKSAPKTCDFDPILLLFYSNVLTQFCQH